jgi:hypothetical protein
LKPLGLLSARTMCHKSHSLTPAIVILAAVIWMPGVAVAQSSTLSIDRSIDFDLASVPTRSARQLLEVVAVPAECTGTSDPDVIVVCARNDQNHRLDQDVLRSTRESESGPPQPSARAQAMRPACEPTSAQGCPEANAIPLSTIAFTLFEAAVMAANGDDWREALPNRPPDAYEIYRQRRSRPRR